MIKIIQRIIEKCDLSIQHNPATGFSAGASGPLPVLALAAIIIVVSLIFGR